ncbi:hypothetical protein ABGB07_45115 [Micromonosporaceae bacterium B7E4]
MGEKIDPIILDLYKISVEMVDRISARRSTANAFFLTAQTTFIAVLGINGLSLQKVPWWVSLAIALAGFALSASWWLQLRSYRDLNRAKFAVINSMEEHFPVKVFGDEWKTLKLDPVKRWRPRYAELGAVERAVPWIFAGIYALLFAGRVMA